MSQNINRHTRPIGVLSLPVTAVFFAACSVYDPGLLAQTGKTPSETGLLSEDAATDASADGAHAAEANTDVDAHADAFVDNCIVSPEICDGEDNNCDGETDGPEATQSCRLSNAIAVCEEGECRIKKCDYLFGNCDDDDSNGCERPLDTSADCGECDKTCGELERAARVECVGGVCTATECEVGYGDCDGEPENGCQTPLNTFTDCGACGLACAGVSCEGGRCSTLQCESGFADCDGDTDNNCEARLTTTTDCAMCGNTCAFTNALSSCDAGKCEFVRCTPGYGDCDDDLSNGCETSLVAISNCGQCGEICSNPEGDAYCTGGVCTTLACKEGLADCDADHDNGCETSIRTLEDCGFCGAPCASPDGQSVSCESGVCELVECPEGQYDCDQDPANGCESTLRDNDNCGACDTPCELNNATTSCSSGECELISCKPSYADCNDKPTDGCEAQIGTDANCSSCGDACERDEFCEAGQCQPKCIAEECLCLIPAQFPCCTDDGTCGCAFPFAPCFPTV